MRIGLSLLNNVPNWSSIACKVRKFRRRWRYRLNFLVHIMCISLSRLNHEAIWLDHCRSVGLLELPKRQKGEGKLACHEGVGLGSLERLIFCRHSRLKMTMFLRKCTTSFVRDEWCNLQNSTNLYQNQYVKLARAGIHSAKGVPWMPLGNQWGKILIPH